MPATALIFHLIVTDRDSHAPVLIDSVDAIPLQALYGLCADVVLSDSIVYGFLIQNPARFQNSLEPSKALDFDTICFYAACTNS